MTQSFVAAAVTSTVLASLVVVVAIVTVAPWLTLHQMDVVVELCSSVS